MSTEQERAALAARRFWNECPAMCSTGAYRDGFVSALGPYIEQAIRSEVLRALEEAINAVCPWCAITESMGGRLVLDEAGTIHRHLDTDDVHECKSRRVRALAAKRKEQETT